MSAKRGLIVEPREHVTRRAVDFDDESRFETGEIHDMRSEQSLPFEFPSEQTMRAQVARLRANDGPPDDLDADGVPDSADPCPSVFFEGGACPSYPRSVTIRRTRTKVHGSLKSAAAECLNGAVVRFQFFSMRIT